MGVTFHVRPVNGPFEDPSVYVRILREKRAILFDVGYIGRLGAANLLKVSDVFVTHTHIDHFIGFDLLLRTVLRREVPLRVYGPEGITRCVEGKLGGYSWNLITDYPIKIEVFEVRGNHLAHGSFHAANSFRRQDHPEAAFTGILLDELGLRVRGVELTHDIPVMAYSIEEDNRININKAKLADRGLPVGPWLNSLKTLIRKGATPDAKLLVSGRDVRLAELMEIVTITKGQRVCYVMDVAPNEENVRRVIAFVAGADHLFCEAYFLAADTDRARERNHLTAALAGRIGREAEVGVLTPMHFSPKYREDQRGIYSEVLRELGPRGVLPPEAANL